MSGTEDIVHLEVDDVFVSYSEAMGCPVELVPDQLRDRGALESAVARSQQYAAYEPTSDIALLAAVLAHGITKDHPFVEGNKRTAEVALLTFLAINGYWLSEELPEEQLFLWMKDLAIDLQPKELAARLRDWLREIAVEYETES
jgi:death on curing protein